MDAFKETIETYNKIAKLYQDKFMQMDLYNETYDLFCKLVEKQNAKILEIGCGPGNITKYILNQRPDFQAKALDAAANMLDLAKINNPTAEFLLMDARNIHQIEDTFDGIVCGFCLPYLSKEESEKLIRDSADLLSENGIFYFSVEEGDYAKSGIQSNVYGQIYFYYHEENYMREYLAQSGFEIIQLFRVNFPRPNTVDSVHLVFVARKK